MNVVRVVNGVAPAGAVAIGRGSVWGNPFLIGADGERERVIAKFRHYAMWRLEREPDWLEPLRGKDLACYCAPKPCHGHVILELLEVKKTNGIRLCAGCKFDMDAESAVPCAEHKWHFADPYAQDMCCACGLDAEMLVK